MKTRLLIILFFITTIGGFAQITVKTAAAPVIKHVYDSTVNVNLEDLQGMKGQTIFFPPTSSGKEVTFDKSFVWTVIYSDYNHSGINTNKCVLNKYFIIDDVLPHNYDLTPKNDTVFFKLVNKDNDSIIYYKMGKEDDGYHYYHELPFITQGYYEKLKSKIGEKYHKDSRYSDKKVYEINTGEEIPLKENEIYTISDVIVTNTGEKFLKPAFVLKTSSGKEFMRSDFNWFKKVK